MSDLDPAPIERLLQEAAQRRGVPVDAYRDLVQAVADVAGVDFATALRVMAVFEKLPAAERNALFEQLSSRQRTSACRSVSTSGSCSAATTMGNRPSATEPHAQL